LYYLLENGGSGYFRSRVVEHYLKSGALARVEKSPEFTYPIYLVYPRDNTNSCLQAAMDSLHQVVANDNDWSQKSQFLPDT
jgi:DNA-binding transcriptional LysR family regulator